MHGLESVFIGGHSHLEVICGPMFSGKTEELIRRIRRVTYARMRAIVFKPSIDVRYSYDLVVSHSEQKMASIPLPDIARVRAYLARTAEPFQVVGIDEAHLFDNDIVSLCEDLVNQGVRVVVAGLCEDYLLRPFGAMPELLVHADSVTKLLAVCMRCGLPASKSQRILRPGQEKKEEQVVVGAGLYYEARCRSCHVKAVVELNLEDAHGTDLVNVQV